eukprot:7044414-Pyramimonas_sp.AAC.1
MTWKYRAALLRDGGPSASSKKCCVICITFCRSRFRLFDAVVTSTVLYGSGAWTMTAARETTLQTELRNMLRKVVATPPMKAVSEGGTDE